MVLCVFVCACACVCTCVCVCVRARAHARTRVCMCVRLPKELCIETDKISFAVLTISLDNFWE